MNMQIERFTPPGYSLKWEKRFVVLGIFVSAFISLGFFVNLISEIRGLYYVDEGKRYLRENAVCRPFSEIAPSVFICFTVTALTCLFFIVIRRLYMNEDSKSIYTVKRLPRSCSVIRLTVPVPLHYFISVIAIKYLVMVLYLVIYLISVPNAALHDYWSEGIWRL